MATLHRLTIVNESTGKIIPVIQINDDIDDEGTAAEVLDSLLVSGQMTVEEVLNTYAAKINLPQNTRGHLIRKTTHKEIPPNQTLQSEGMKSNEVLIVDFERTAGGGGVIINSYKDIQIIDTYLNREQANSYHYQVVYSIILYTAADKNLSTFVKDNFLELHHLAGHDFMFYVVERPDPIWIPLMRKELGDELGPQVV